MIGLSNTASLIVVVGLASLLLLAIAIYRHRQSLNSGPGPRHQKRSAAYDGGCAGDGGLALSNSDSGNATRETSSADKQKCDSSDNADDKGFWSSISESFSNSSCDSDAGDSGCGGCGD